MFAASSKVPCKQTLSCTNLVQRPPRTPGRCRLLIRAENKGGLDFKPTKSGDTGYMKEDSAGQENIFAVESKAFVAGSAKDTSTNAGANAAYAGLAAALAALAIGGGVFLTKDKAAVSPSKVFEEAPKESLSSISKRLSPVVKSAVNDVQNAPATVQENLQETPLNEAVQDVQSPGL